MCGEAAAGGLVLRFGGRLSRIGPISAIPRYIRHFCKPTAPFLDTFVTSMRKVTGAVLGSFGALRILGECISNNRYLCESSDCSSREFYPLYPSEDKPWLRHGCELVYIRVRGGKAQRPRTAYLIPARARALGGARDSDRHWLSKELFFFLFLFLSTFGFCCSVVSRSSNFGAWSARIDAGRRDLHFSTEKLGLIRRFSGLNGFESWEGSGDGGLCDAATRSFAYRPVTGAG